MAALAVVPANGAGSACSPASSGSAGQRKRQLSSKKLDKLSDDLNDQGRAKVEEQILQEITTHLRENKDQLWMVHALLKSK
eukprot:1525752-Lingulodinium_polyedra.AAC.1